MIGIIDSGLGGVMILFSLMKKYPLESFTLIYDNNFFPYGEKTKEELIERTNFLIDRIKCTKAILACNTLSTLRDYLNYDVFDVITPTLDVISQYDRIGIIASRFCINSGFYQNKINMLKKKPYPIDGQRLINAIETGENIEEAFMALDIPDLDCLILGCTHFILIKDMFREKYSFPIISQDELIILT